MRKVFYIVFVGVLLSTSGLFAQEAPQEPAPQENEAQQAPEAQATAKEETLAAEDALAKDLEAAKSGTENTSEGFVTARESVQENPVSPQKPKVVFNPRTRRDPTLSPDDFLLIQHR